MTWRGRLSLGLSTIQSTRRTSYASGVATTRGNDASRESEPSREVAVRLTRFPTSQRKALERTWQAMTKALPGAAPAISYGLPTLQVDGISVLAVDGFTRHNSLFPYSGGIFAALASELAPYERTKGSIHFSLDRPFPAPLLKRIIRLRIEEINASFPNRTGHVKAFYDNGFLKHRGRIRGGEPHGEWTWYRRDGSVVRSGSFAKGTRVGAWTAYDRSGGPIAVTHHRDDRGVEPTRRASKEGRSA